MPPLTPLTPRICAYLANTASEWTPAPMLYALANKHGYSHDDIRTALSEIAHTPAPYATWSVSDGDYHAQKEPGVTGKGVYYRKHHLTPVQHAIYKRSVEAFDALP